MEVDRKVQTDLNMYIFSWNALYITNFPNVDHFVTLFSLISFTIPSGSGVSIIFMIGLIYFLLNIYQFENITFYKWKLGSPSVLVLFSAATLFRQK